MDTQAALDFLQTSGLVLAQKLIAAIAIWFIGRWLIGFAVGMLTKAMGRRNVDPTLIRYAESGVKVTLTIVLVVALLGYFGVETASFAALLAGVGLAIGTAWGGLLQNFASGVFMVMLRPFRVGDTVTVAGVTGVVEEIGLLTTIINTYDNVRTIIGNDKVFGDTIQNYDANPYRRINAEAQLSGDTDYRDAIRRFREALDATPGVLQDPEPSIEILEFNLAGPVVGVRSYATPENYWDVWFATRRIIQDVTTEAGYSTPGSPVAIVAQAPGDAESQRLG